jgi:glycosyltransferase involved in cell wall biosynthesis
MVADARPLASPGATLAVVVPTLNDDAALGRLLPLLARLDSPPEHVIVVDGAASEATAALCRGASLRSGTPCTWVPSRPGRGLQLRAGIEAARAAGAEIFWMVHADCEPHALAARAAREAIAGGAAGGYFAFRFGGERSAVKRALEICIAWRCRLSMVYGDQGIFVSRAAYDETPGIGPRALFEEVPLVRALRRTRRFAAVPLPIIVSERRWRRDGLLLRTVRNRLLAVGFAAGIDEATLERWYRASRARQPRS